jgi:SlyX protein
MSNTAMTNPETTDQRLTDLEIKATYTEDLVEQLDKIIARQQQQIDLLLREVAELRQPALDGTPTTGRSLREDLPPHF